MGPEFGRSARLSVEAKDARSRERFLALYMNKQTSACAWARTIGRTKETVLKWVHAYSRCSIVIRVDVALF